MRHEIYGSFQLEAHVTSDAGNIHINLTVNEENPGIAISMEAYTLLMYACINCIILLLTSMCEPTMPDLP